MVTKLKTGTKVGQLGIWDGTQWVAGDPDCNIIKWGGTALTGRDITTLLDHLNVDLSTRASTQNQYAQQSRDDKAKMISGTSTIVPQNTWTTVRTYTVTASKTFYLTRAGTFLLGNAAGGAPTTGAMSRYTEGGTQLYNRYIPSALACLEMVFTVPRKIAAGTVINEDIYNNTNNEYANGYLIGWEE